MKNKYKVVALVPLEFSVEGRLLPRIRVYVRRRQQF